MQQLTSITHTSHALDIWQVSRCLPRDDFKSGCGELGGQGAVTVYTHPATCTSFLLVCVPVKGLLEQAICSFWLQGTSNWKGWDHGGNKYLGENKKWLDSWMSRKARARCCGAQRGECHALLRLGKNTNLPTFTASRLGCCTLPSWSKTPV